MGIPINQVKEYWESRAKEQGEKTVGFCNKPIKEQDSNYKERALFLAQHLPMNKKTLDFGSGIGRHCCLFDKNKYLGVELTKELFSISTIREPKYKFKHIKVPYLPLSVVFDYEVLFTATVLQHNSDESVIEILQSFKEHKKKEFSFYLYENSSKNKDSYHISFRSSGKYIELVSSVFGAPLKHCTHSHVVHGEEHSLTIIDY